MVSDFHIIEDKLNRFIGKFYLNRLYQGLIFYFLFILFGIFAFSFVEFFAFLSPITKTILFYSFVSFAFLSLIFLIIIPLCKLLKFIPIISYEEASYILSNYFKDNNNIILNILELNSYSSGYADADLLIAAINQKIDLIKPFKFSLAIDFGKTFKFFLFSLAVIIPLIIIGSFNFDSFKAGASRFIDYSTFYQPQNPYTFTLLNKDFNAARGEDLLLKISIHGPDIPQDVFINYSGQSFRMNNDSSSYFSYKFHSVNSDLDFNFSFINYSTEFYHISLYEKPVCNNFSVHVKPPLYTGLPESDFSQAADLFVPHGSVITWNISSVNSSKFDFLINDSITKSYEVSSSDINLSNIALKNFNYSFVLFGKFNNNFSSPVYSVTVVEDKYPSINIKPVNNSLALGSVTFYGDISDDFGFHSLSFNYYYSSDPNNIKSENIDFNKSSTRQNFMYYIDFSKLNIDQFSSLVYYFEVKDNDAISSYKSSKTFNYCYKQLSRQESISKSSSMDSLLNADINKSNRLLQEIQKDISDFQKSVSSSKDMSDYEKQLKLQSILNKRNSLEQLLNNISQLNKSKDNLDNSINKKTDELLQKQEDLQKLWDNLLTDELKDLFDKIQKLLNTDSDKSLRDSISGLKLNLDKLSEKIDRNSKLMNMFKVEKDLNSLSSDLNSLSDTINKVSREIPDKNLKSSQLEKLQNDFQKSHDNFNDLKLNYNQIFDKNQQSGNYSLPLKDLKNDFNSISESFNNLDKQINNQNTDHKQNRSDLNDLSKKLKDLSDKISSDLNSSKSSKIEENANDIRQILDNLITFSLNQEEVMQSINSSPQFISLKSDCFSRQINLKNDFDIIRDSIYSVAKREPEISEVIYDKLSDISILFDKTFTNYNTNQFYASSVSQRQILTNVNDLALIFNESLIKMENQQKQGSSSQQSRANSTINKKSSSSERQQQLKQMQQQQQSLKDMLQQMYNSIQKGDKPSIQQLVESLKNQELMLQQLNELLNQSQSSGQQKKLLNEINNLMKQNRSDIVHQNFTNQTIKRQAEIQSKLLDAQNAEMKQEEDEQRKSNEGSQILQKDFIIDRNLFRLNNNSQEYLNHSNINLNLFYQNKFNMYINNIK